MVHEGQEAPIEIPFLTFAGTMINHVHIFGAKPSGESLSIPGIK
jgi:hypothetical protein